MTLGSTFAGRYRLIQHLGTGGFAQVWKAEDTMAEDAIIAIKIFAPDKGMDADGIKVFRREFALTLPLSHPHLLKTYHFDVHEGSPYLIMPYCSQGSLMGKVADQYRFSEREMAEILLQLSGALNHLHQEHICHQDMKPDNVLILKPGHYVVSDFGISSKARRTVARSMRAEQAQGYSAFTPAYAPPEKYTSRPTPAGDVFSLGVTLYELATGDVAFEDIGAALERGAEIPDLPAQYSRDLNAWIKSCMAYKPEARPEAATLEKAARQYLQQGSWPSTTAQSPAPAVSKAPRRTQKMESPPEPPAMPTDIKPHSEPVTALPETKPKGKGRLIGIALLAVLLLATAGYFGKDLLEGGEDPNQLAYQSAITQGDSLLRLGEYPEAKTRFEGALDLMPADSLAMARLAAISAHEDSLQNAGELLVQRGDSLFAQANFEEARLPYQAATELLPTMDLWQQKLQLATDSLSAQTARLAAAQARADSLQALKEAKQEEWNRKRAPYSYISEFRKGLAAAKSKKDGKYGVINEAYELVIPLKYGNVGLCKDGYIIVTDKPSWEVNSYVDQKKALFSPTGKALTPFKYVDIECFSEGLAAVKLYKGYGDFPWGFVDRNGKEVIPLQYFSVNKFQGGRAKVTEQKKAVLPARAGASYYIDKSGKCVADCP